jgi:hypothetical protein
LFALALVACNGSEGDPAPGAGGAAGGGGAAPTNPLGEAITLTLEPFEVAPGTERQVCKTVNLPAGAEVDIVRMHSTMQGTSHHFNVYKVLTGDVTAPVTPAEATVDDCAPGADQLGGTAAYIFGSATPERTVDTPAGVAFHLLDGHRIILEQHVINTTTAPIQGGATFELVKAGEGANIEHHADIMWLANWLLFLPALQETAVTERCEVPYDVQVFGLMSHTHGLGTHFSIERYDASGEHHLYDSWDWAHPPYLALSPMLHMAPGEGFEWTCTYSNPTMDMVMAGQNSTDEMCMMFAYAYPTGSLSAEPYQCNKPL